MTVRFFSLLLALCLTVAASAQGAYTADFPAGSTMARLAKAPTLRIGVKYDQPLFGMRNLSGQPEGFDIDLATLIAGKLGFPPDKITWVETSAPNREPFLQQNRVDLVIATYYHYRETPQGRESSRPLSGGRASADGEERQPATVDRPAGSGE